jgi:hypothetical protein
MAQHDYVIDNQSGAAFRADLNNGLAAIVSQNSGTNQPSTTYAYQWWADTTTGLLKIRNAANNAWITVGTLASANLGLLTSGSTLTAALGSASTPGITFTGDLNTGIYSPGADQVAISTNGTGRLFVGSDGSVGVGGSNLATVPLLVQDTGNGVVIQNTASGNYAIGLLAGTGSQDAYVYQRASAPLIFGTNNTERMRLTSTGLLGLGTSSASTILTIQKSIDSTAYGSGTQVIDFKTPYPGFDVDTIKSSIYSGVSSQTPLATNKGYLAFLTHNGTSLTEKLRIESDGRAGIGTTSPGALLHVAGECILGDNGTNGRLTVNTTTSTVGLFATTTGFDAYEDLELRGAVTIFKRDGTNESARIDSSGRLGIGTDTPSTYDAAARNLVINQSSGDGGLTIHTGTSATGSIYFADASSGNASSEGRVSYDHSQNELSLSTSRLRRGLFGTNGTFFSMALTNVLSGQSSASAGTTFTLFQGTHSATEGVRDSGTASIQIYTNGNIQNTNNSYGQLSDIKLKESILDAGSQWDDIKAIEIKNFNFIGDATRQLGVIAQQVETVSPGLIYETADQEQGQLTGTTTKAVKYSVLYMKAVKALQEAMERIEQLESKVAALEGV